MLPALATGSPSAESPHRLKPRFAHPSTATSSLVKRTSPRRPIFPFPTPSPALLRVSPVYITSLLVRASSARGLMSPRQSQVLTSSSPGISPPSTTCRHTPIPITIRHLRRPRPALRLALTAPAKPLQSSDSRSSPLTPIQDGTVLPE